MTVASPPRAPETDDERGLEERVAELEALIEEARRRARRRRAVTAAVLLALAAAAAVTVDFGGRSGVPLGGSIAEGSPGGAANTSGEGRWGPLHGPEGGDVLALAVDPGDPAIAYAGGWGVVFKTTNGGKKWRNVTTKQPWGGRVTALAVDPTRTATVYVATERGVARTTNGGRSWSAVNAGLFDHRETPERREHRLAEGFVRSMMVDSGRPSTAYLTTSRGLFRMTDGGARWWRVVGPPSVRPYRFVAAAIDPGRPGLVYASWMERRKPWNRKLPNLYKSTDSGSTWQRIDVKGRRPEFWSLAVDPHRAGTLYVADGSWPNGRLWKSDDDGATWRITGLAGQYVTSFWVDPSPRATVFAATVKGTLRSSDGGVTWRRLGQGVLPGYSVVASHPLAPDTLYGSDRSGLVKSVDGGRMWRPINAGFVSTVVDALALAPGSSEALYAGTTGGVRTSVDGGRSWRAAPNGLEGKIVHSFAVESRRRGAVYAGTRGFGVFKSSDGGLSWRPVNAGLRVEIVAALAVDPKRPDTVYAGAERGGVYKSVDGGAAWSATTLRANGVQSLAVDPRDPSTVFAGTTGGLFRSSDGGDSWQLVVTAAAAGVRLDRGVGNPGTFQAVAIDPANPETVYAGIRTGGILKSLDGGDTWARANAGRVNPGVDTLAVDPRDPRTLYAAGDGGVFRSTDGARSWHRFDRGLGGTGVKALAVPPNGRTVFAGTSGRGVVGLEPAG